MFQKECIKSKAEFEQTFVGCTSNTCQEGKYNKKNGISLFPDIIPVLWCVCINNHRLVQRQAVLTSSSLL